MYETILVLLQKHFYIHNFLFNQTCTTVKKTYLQKFSGWWMCFWKLQQMMTKYSDELFISPHLKKKQATSTSTVPN